MGIVTKPIETSNPGGALIGFNNVLITATISSGTTNPNKALTPNTWERWRPTAANLTAKFQMGDVDTDINYIAIAAHNLIGETLLLSTAATEGGTLTDVESITFTNNDPIMITFDTRTVREVAIQSTYSVVKEIGVVYAGKTLDMPRAIYGGHSPITLSARTDYQSVESETGQSLGLTIIRQGLETNYSWRFLEPDFYRESFLPFVISARTIPFFIKWRPDFFPDEVAYGRPTGDIIPDNMGGGHKLMSVSFTMRAHADV